jgi:hypothetical protein
MSWNRRCARLQVHDILTMSGWQLVAGYLDGDAEVEDGPGLGTRRLLAISRLFHWERQTTCRPLQSDDTIQSHAQLVAHMRSTQGCDRAGEVVVGVAEEVVVEGQGQTRRREGEAR